MGIIILQPDYGIEHPVQFQHPRRHQKSPLNNFYDYLSCVFHYSSPYFLEKNFFLTAGQVGSLDSVKISNISLKRTLLASTRLQTEPEGTHTIDGYVYVPNTFLWVVFRLHRSTEPEANSLELIKDKQNWWISMVASDIHVWTKPTHSSTPRALTLCLAIGTFQVHPTGLVPSSAGLAKLIWAHWSPTKMVRIARFLWYQLIIRVDRIGI